MRGVEVKPKEEILVSLGRGRGKGKIPESAKQPEVGAMAAEEKSYRVRFHKPDEGFVDDFKLRPANSVPRALMYRYELLRQFVQNE